MLYLGSRIAEYIWPCRKNNILMSLSWLRCTGFIAEMGEEALLPVFVVFVGGGWGAVTEFFFSIVVTLVLINLSSFVHFFLFVSVCVVSFSVSYCVLFVFMLALFVINSLHFSYFIPQLRFICLCISLFFIVPLHYANFIIVSIQFLTCSLPLIFFSFSSLPICSLHFTIYSVHLWFLSLSFVIGSRRAFSSPLIPYTLFSFSLLFFPYFFLKRTKVKRY